MKEEDQIKLDQVEDVLIKKELESRKKPMIVSGKSVFRLKEIIENKNKNR